MTSHLARLLEFLPTLEGAVILSGYPHATYDTALEGWHRVETHAHADGALDRVEVLWLNAKAWTQRLTPLEAAIAERGAA